MHRLAAWVLVAAAVASTAVSGLVAERMAAGRDEARSLLYLPNGKHLRTISLGHAPLLADFVYLWAIQFYSDYDREERFQYVEHVFSDVIAELDPRFVDAYWLGAMILIVEAGRLDDGLALLERGFERNPDQWILPYLAGWEAWMARQPARAAEYFRQASAVPGAPVLTRRMQAGMLRRAGDERTALGLWRELLEDPASDEASRAIASRKVRELEGTVLLAGVREAVERYRSETGALPRSLEALAQRGYLSAVPRDPSGRPFHYDPRTGRVAPPSGRVLGGDE